jgi:4-hydroxy-tetrahydrodipicolinate synthase
VSSLVLKGVIPPVLSPLNVDETLDETALRSMIERQLAAGVHGIFALGSAGEGTYLRQSERRRVVKTAVETIGGRVPLIVGVSDCTVSRVREQMDDFAMPGVDAFVATLPYYGDFSSAAIQLSFYRALADESPRPIVVYNIPQAVHGNLEPATVLALAKHPNIVALKDSAGNLTPFHQILLGREDPSFAVFQGIENVSGAAMSMGADGLVSGLGNVIPSWIVGLYETAKRGDWESVREQQARLSTFWTVLGNGHWLGCLKAAAGLMGLCAPTVSRPIPSCSDSSKTMTGRAMYGSSAIVWKAW